MILIISSETDESTNDVINWIKYFEKEFVRINAEDKLNVSVEITNNEQRLKLYNNEFSVDLDSVLSYWYRRGDIKFEVAKNDWVDKFKFRSNILYNLNNENKVVASLFHNELLKKKCIGSRLNVETNKLINLIEAKHVGLDIPDTLILNKKTSLFDLWNRSKMLVSKAISETIHLISDTGIIQAYTGEVEKNDGDFKYLSLFQQKIEKQYEIRVFYLEKEIYAMAIFSQEDKKTSIDYRRYNLKKPNRTVPYILPVEIKKKIKLFMRNIGQNSGSIDMIVDKNNNYLFLEVNPVGQFGMLSTTCNYNIEKKIAKYLCENE